MKAPETEQTAPKHPPLTRRALLAALPSLAMARGAIGETLDIDVAGPWDSDAAAWARVLQPALEGGLSAGAGIALHYAGAPDGVTGANQFDARAMPDGAAALMFPGAAALAWLAGDPRVHFDGGRLVPLVATVSPGVLVMRRPGWITTTGPLRVACGSAVEPAAAALLGLDLLGILATPVTPRANPVAAANMDEIDAAFLSGGDVPARLPRYAASGLTPFFTVGDLPGAGITARDPALPGVPTLAERLPRLAPAHSPLLRAWQSCAGASVLVAALALPRLTPLAALHRWRRASGAGLDQPSVQQDAALRGRRLLDEAASHRLFEMILTDAAAQAEFQRWLTERMHWQPG